MKLTTKYFNKISPKLMPPYLSTPQNQIPPSLHLNMSVLKLKKGRNGSKKKNFDGLRYPGKNVLT